MTSKPLWVVSIVLAIVLVGGCAFVDPKEAAFQVAYREEVKKAEALYAERCATVAGEKIYKTVDNVEGILLMNVPSTGGERAWFERNWPGAAFAHERSARLLEVIDTFLWYQHRSPDGHTSLDTGVSPWPGYRYVDVIGDTGRDRDRYTLVRKPRATSKIGWIDTLTEKNPTTAAMPRYGIQFDDRVIAEERALWVASGVVKVIDLSNNEVLGELTRYAIAYSRPVPGASPPWLGIRACGGQGSDHVARNFVQKVLIPVKEEKQ